MEHRISDLDRYLFGNGTHYEIYEKMGAHTAVENGVPGTYFAVWAPNAAKVSVVGDFNSWDREADPMELLEDSGIWDAFVPGAGEGSIYKYCIETGDGRILYKSDPYGQYFQLRPENASRVPASDTYKWGDSRWRSSSPEMPADRPMAIYEVHLGSWKRDGDLPDGFKDYRSLAHELADYVKYMGYTHVELIGIAEHPFDGSWGYQVTGYYSPTSRYGTPEDFRYFVDYLHRKGIGVILDWVPAHFPKDDFSLAHFDGQPLYEHADPRRGERAEWGTYCFNYSKNEVSNFLIANALFWLEKYHIDGLRVDAVASMLYLDFGRKDGEWIPNADGGREDYDAVQFLKHLNSVIKSRCPKAMTIAEESTAWPLVTGSPEDGGLGFTYKWNMGWMHDFLEYMAKDPIYRQYHQNLITFSFSYACTERFVLVLSHDEVVHLKKSMILKMPGSMPLKFGNLRAAYGYQIFHPGKKLLFMGQDFAQYNEWSEARSIDWYLLDNYPEHRALNNYCRELLHFYSKYKALYALDDSPEGFAWINGADCQKNMITFCRMTPSGRNCLLININFSPVPYPEFRSGTLCPGKYTEVFNSDAEEFGGSGMTNPEPIMAEEIPWDGKGQSIGYRLGGFGVAVFKFNMKK
ncbi:MAG: 1,4-alpha-glucan branching protein GlgB [Lachnospiraceae bacterium]|nr:1,4-alpha-glucan branching protein GlgB [Lachnospiraceae bacterium]